jgi:GTP cyclohydrolase IA
MANPDALPDNPCAIALPHMPHPNGRGWCHGRQETPALPPKVLVAQAGVRSLLTLCGEDPDRPGLADTPARVARSFMEMTSGMQQDPAAILARTFSDMGNVDQMVVLRRCPVVSLCEHHMLPFTGYATVGYLPGSDTVVGLSKLARLVDCYARRFQVQERLTMQVAQALMEHLGATGAGCRIEATHSCMALRGVRKTEATMVTSALLGTFRDQPDTRAEFMALGAD